MAPLARLLTTALTLKLVVRTFIPLDILGWAQNKYDVLLNEKLVSVFHNQNYCFLQFQFVMATFSLKILCN